VRFLLTGSLLGTYILRRAVEEIGRYWEKVSEHVGRPGADCRDRYRNHLSERDTRNIGTLGFRILLLLWCSSANMVDRYLD
jgi:Myb-like DNA-binding domain